MRHALRKLFCRRPSVRDLLVMILEGINTMSERSDALLAQVTANTDALKSIASAVDVLNEGHATIGEEIAALKEGVKTQGSDVDFSKLEAAVAEQASVIGGLSAAIPAGTPFQASNN